MSTPPKLDPRTAKEIAQQVRDLLRQPPIAAPLKDDSSIGTALVGIFARFAELIIQRLNQVPDKNFLAFLDLLGASRLPPQPARVPLTFSLAPGSTQAVVPSGTQVAAPPPPGEKDPIIFETEQELIVTAAQLASVFVRDPEQDFYADYSPIASGIAPISSQEVPIFRGNRAIAHIFYIGQSDLFDLPDVSLDSPQVQTLTIVISVARVLGDGGQLQWQVWDGQTWQDKRPGEAPNNASNLAAANNGECQIIFSPSFNKSEIKAVPLSTVASEESRWLRCLLKPNIPITTADTPQAGRVRVSQLPLINSIRFRLAIAPPDGNPSPLAIETAFTNALPIDLTQPFFPFGEKPKFGDTFYLANREAFSKSGAAITLQLALVNLADVGITPTNDSINRDLKLQWEFWDEGWKPIGVSNRLDPGTSSPDRNFRDSTLAFTQREHPAPSVQFTLPKKPLKPTIVNGVENFWIRVRIVAGDYGKEATYVSKPDTQPASYEFKPASFAPPVVGSLKVGYTVVFEQSAPDKILTYNDFAYRIVKRSSDTSFRRFPPFNPTPDKPSLYLGFVVPSDRSFPNRPVSLFVQAADVKYDEKLVPLSPTSSRRAANSGSSAGHTFTLTNPASTDITFKLSLMGMQPGWTTTGAPPTLTLSAGATQDITLQVAIPPTAPIGSRDRASLILTKSDAPDVTYTATFETIARSDLPANQRLQLTWQYWNGTQWTKLTVRDDSENFTRSGLIEFLPPADMAPREDFGVSSRYWLRVRWESGDYDVEPRLRRILLNTTIAAQTVTLHNEILGSSDGTEHQRFLATRSPILPGQQLQVRELERPSAQEKTSLEAEEGGDAISLSDPQGVVPDLLGSSRDVWVRWHEVSDFYRSGARSRHYVLDRLTGEIQFGNGINGLVPPIAVGNVRLTRYQTGGGTAGNQPEGTIVQLKTTVPYVDKVTNPIAAAGGANAESLDSLRDRVPRELRHSHRAVTLEDYEDLAMLASPEVARAQCVPLLNLRQSPKEVQNPFDQPPKAPGNVSLIIVPRSIDAKPLPSLELISRVQSFLNANTSPTIDLFVVGPLYIRVDVTAEIALTSLEGSSTVKQAVEQTLDSFLHPLTGGLDGAGWAFGREPHLSDLYALIEAIPGIDYVRTLTVKPPPYPPGGVKETDRFLVYSGNHVISLFFDTP
ncbi:putative baseplate assembly protein [Phormidesmis priestleyi]